MSSPMHLQHESLRGLHLHVSTKASASYLPSYKQERNFFSCAFTVALQLMADSFCITVNTRYNSHRGQNVDYVTQLVCLLDLPD